MKKFEVYAHRGGKLLPNHISTFRYAGSIGVDGVEADVCLTSDGEPIIYHPGTLKQPEPMSMTWKQLAGWNYKVAHLDELLDVLSVYPNLKCLLDIKIDSPDLVQKIVPRLATGNLKERIFLTAPKKKSFFADFVVDADILEYAKALDGQVKIHVIDTMPLNMAGTVKRHKADMISFGWLNDSVASQVLFGLIFKSGLKKAGLEVAKAQKEGARVMAGIANTPKEISELLVLFPSIDAVMTDNPEIALSVGG